MADYKFDKPWAADSQNVKTFTEEEWEKGIPFKSLTESKVVNGVLQDVTSRFLELEAVEDRQFVFDFVVDDDVSEQNFITGNTGNAKSVLVKKNINADEITINPAVLLLSIQTSNKIDANKITSNNTNILTITGGGRLFSDLKNWETAGRIQVTQSSVGGNNITGGGILLSNCYIYNGGGVIDSVSINNSRVGSLGGTAINNSRISETIIALHQATNSTFVDCEITSASQLINSTLVRCTLPKNTKLTNCNLIDCDYTVDTYTENLVKGTTFKECNLDVQAPNAILNGNLFANGINNTPCLFVNCKLYFLLPNGNCVTGIARDCEFIATTAGTQSVALVIEGNSSMQISSLYNADQFENKMRDINKYGIIRTDNPFFRNGSNARSWDLGSSTVIYPGVLNVIRDEKNLTTFTDNKNHGVKYFFMNPSMNGVNAGSIIGTSSTFKFIVPVSSSQRTHTPEFSVIL